MSVSFSHSDMVVVDFPAVTGIKGRDAQVDSRHQHGDREAKWPREWAMRDSNPRHPACKAESSPTESTTAQQVTSSDSLRCPARCTESEETANADPLAGFVASLSPEQRQRLADLLAGSKEGGAS